MNTASTNSLYLQLAELTERQMDALEQGKFDEFRRILGERQVIIDSLPRNRSTEGTDILRAIIEDIARKDRAAEVIVRAHMSKIKDQLLHVSKAGQARRAYRRTVPRVKGALSTRIDDSTPRFIDQRF